MKEKNQIDEGILIFGQDDFFPAQRLAATLNNEVAIFMHKSDGTPPSAIIYFPKLPQQLYYLADYTELDKDKRRPD